MLKRVLHIICSLIFALTMDIAWAETSDVAVDTFSEIYEKLDSMQWGGKSIDVVIENLESLSSDAHLAVTDDRIILVYGDSIIGNFQKPSKNDWKNYGKITVLLIDKMRDKDDGLAAVSIEEVYERAFGVLMRGIDESGKFISKKTVVNNLDDRILTSLGISGWRDKSGDFRVGAIVKGSTADVSGIQIYDLIDKVNGRNVQDMTDIELDNVFQGLNSGTVKLHLLTQTGNRNVVLRRATIVLTDADIVYRHIGNDAGVLEIIVNELTENAVDIVNEALLKYKNVSGIILDLRTTGGTDAKSATKLAGLFLGQKPVMRITQTVGEDMEFVPGGDAITDAKLVVLISDTTSGTAEAVVSGIYEHGRGVLVGTPTAGKARVMTHIDLSNGDALELLNKSIKSGSGIVLDDRGVFPVVCLANIRSDKQKNAFFVNVINDDFKIQDFNKNKSISPDVVRRGCPIITSGEDEDKMAIAVATKILMDESVYNKLVVEQR